MRQWGDIINTISHTSDNHMDIVTAGRCFRWIWLAQMRKAQVPQNLQLTRTRYQPEVGKQSWYLHGQIWY